jgi:hypothetical protein
MKGRALARIATATTTSTTPSQAWEPDIFANQRCPIDSVSPSSGMSSQDTM